MLGGARSWFKLLNLLMLFCKSYAADFKLHLEPNLQLQNIEVRVT